MSNRKSTTLVELVETHNIALSLNRLKSPLYDYAGGRWKRALYHALSMSEVRNSVMLEKIRVALDLP